MQTLTTIPWAEIRQRFNTWWQRSDSNSPLINLVVRLEEPSEAVEAEKTFSDPSGLYLDVPEIILRRRNFYRRHQLMAEAYPQVSLDLGPGSLALYLGSEPGFARDTVWFNPCVDDISQWSELTYNPDNIWLKRHIKMFSLARSIVGDDWLLNMPDLIENMDTLAALRDTQELIFDMIDDPDLIKRKLAEVDAVYFQHFDRFYDLVSWQGSNSFTAFNIWGPGRTAKLQCDFSALMSPAQFKEFVVPSLRSQCRQLDQSLYHLDGPDAIKHVPALMEIEELDALQWTCGAAQPDGAHDRWLPIYDQVKKAGKALWIMLYDGNAQDWLAGAEKLIKRYGTDGLYINFPPMSQADANQILRRLR